MRNKFVLFLLISIISLASTAIFAQEKSAKQKLQLAVGVAKTVGDKKIVLETKAGILDAVLIKSTTYFRLPPDNLKLSAATESKLADISVSDRVLVTGTYSNDKKSLFAVKVYLVKGSDIAEQQQKQRQEWQQRGVSGRVTAVDTTAKVITIEVRGLTGAATNLKVSPKEEVKYLRYSPTSVKYSDAIKSDFTKISKGDTFQALGDKSEDGMSFKAEEILTGAFVTVAGKIKSVDTEKNEVTIEDLKTKKDVTIAVKETSLMKKFPEQAAQRMARIMEFMQRSGSGNSGASPPRRQGQNRSNNGNRQNRAGNGNRQNRRGGMRRGGGRRGLDINSMLERFPTIKVADLKPGEMIAVSSPKGKDETRLTAIKLLAGVEPFVILAAKQAKGGGGRRGGVSGGLTIPGLDSVQF